MDLNKFLKYFGMLFVVIGMVAGILFIGGALMTRSFPLIFMGVMFPLIFCGVGGFFAWIGGSALKREENLLNPDIDPEKIRTSIGASCPACGATLIVPVGMSAICPYCGRKVTAGKDGSIR